MCGILVTPSQSILVELTMGSYMVAENLDMNSLQSLWANISFYSLFFFFALFSPIPVGAYRFVGYLRETIHTLGHVYRSRRLVHRRMRKQCRTLNRENNETRAGVSRRCARSYWQIP